MCTMLCQKPGLIYIRKMVAHLKVRLTVEKQIKVMTKLETDNETANTSAMIVHNCMFFFFLKSTLHTHQLITHYFLLRSTVLLSSWFWQIPSWAMKKEAGIDPEGI